MHKDVKQCADNGDIKGLRYIFVDSLDVDPTFEKYKEDFDYCKSLSGLFIEHIELSPLIQDENQWDSVYWGKLKSDLLKNFSLERFQHMQRVAKVVYADKIKRISAERQRSNQQTAEPLNANEMEQKNKIMRSSVADMNKKMEEDVARRNEKIIKEAAIANQRFEEERRKAEERKRQLQVKEMRQHQEEKGNYTKKAVGIALAVLVIIVVIIVFILM